MKERQTLKLQSQCRNSVKHSVHAAYKIVFLAQYIHLILSDVLYLLCRQLKVLKVLLFLENWQLSEKTCFLCQVSYFC